MTSRVEWAKFLRWTARLLSVLLLLLFLVFGIGEGLSEWSGSIKLTSTETGLFASLLLCLTGLFLALFRPMSGSLLIITGYMFFSMLDKSLNLDSPFLTFPLIVLLYGIYALLVGLNRSGEEAHTHQGTKVSISQDS